MGVSEIKWKNLKKVYIAFLGVILVFSLYHIYFGNRVIPGVTVSGVKIGGLTFSQAQDKLNQSLNYNNDVMHLKYEGYSYEISKDTIDLEYDWELTLKKAFEKGRTGNVLVDSKDKFLGFFRPITVDAYFFYDDVLLNNLFSQMHGEIDIEPQNATFMLGEDKKSVVVSSSGDGRRFDQEKLFGIVVKALGNLDFSDKAIPVVTESPDISKQDLTGLEQSVSKIIFDPPIIKHQDKTWALTPEQVVDFVTISVTKDSKTPELKINKVKFESYLESLALEINSPPKGEVVSEEDGKVKEFKLTQPGVEVDSLAFAYMFKKALFDGNKIVEVPVKEVTTDANASKYGIRELLATGESKYTGSAKARIQNLSLAAERASGTLVPPGGVFSFNNAVGEISAKTGYDTAYIISNGRTVLGSGGGVCQTSTTLFRAVLNSGLPIVSRHGHAYRVYYYEIDQPVGFDAAIYQPSLDFKFKNDTQNYVLVEANSDKENYTLTFKLYGTSDGRKVEITKPVVTNQTPPPAPLYQDDPTLPKGVTKQIDFAAWGALSTFTRTVTRGDEKLYEDTFTTRYQPWRAVYLVGTKE